MSISDINFLLICIGLVMISVSAFKKESPAERAGRIIAEAVEKAAKPIDRSTGIAGEKIEEAGKKLKDSTNKQR